MPQEAEMQYYKTLELPASGNSRDQNKEKSHSSGNEEKLRWPNDDNLTVKLDERPRRIQNHKRKVLHQQNHKAALGNTFRARTG